MLTIRLTATRCDVLSRPEGAAPTRVPVDWYSRPSRAMLASIMLARLRAQLSNRKAKPA